MLGVGGAVLWGGGAVAGLLAETSGAARVAEGVAGAKGAVGIAADEIRFSQKSVSFNETDRVTKQSYTYDDLVASMKLNGWKGDTVDVVRMPDGELTSMDNTRISAAREAGIEVQATVRSFDEALTPEIQNARGWGKSSTWGEAITARINNQSNGFSITNPYGTLQGPRVKGQP